MGARSALIGLAALAAGCAAATAALAGQSNLPPRAYVAMGSSFAAGPGLAPADTPPTRCGRSVDNYAHVLARRRGLDLTDVSCSGATTAHILGPWNELPPQIAALTPQTGLVTITIGGNDVGYIGSLTTQACRAVAHPAAADGRCREAPPATEADWARLRASLAAIADEVRRRSPNARLVFVSYLTVVPVAAACALTPLTMAELQSADATAHRLSDLTRAVAAEKGVSFLDAGALSANHDACAAEPWASGFPSAAAPVSGAPFHPNKDGMAAIAKALDALLTK